MREGELIGGRFELVRLAGEGGMATVFQAIDRQTGTVVALKLMRSSTQDETSRFMREAQVLSDLSHPGIVRYLAHGSTADECFLAMEWLEGEDLGDRLRRGGLTVAEAVQLGRRVGEALGTAHRRGIVHRDIKPSNLFLPGGEIDRVKILDFGIASFEGSTRRLTRTGMTMGTPGYMAPEQARGERSSDPRTDMFALGCVLFECLTGRPTFGAAHPMAVLGMVLFEESPRVISIRPEIPPELDDIVARMLAKSVELRPADGEALAAEIAAVPSVETAPGPAASVSPPSLTRKEQRIVSVVVASTGNRTTGSAATLPLSIVGPDLLIGAELHPMDALRETAHRHGARVELLADGSIVAVLPGSHAPTEQAIRAARCALAMRAALPGAAMVLATGRGVVESQLPVGEVIDRAARALQGAPSDAIRIDEITAGLLDARFEVHTEGGFTDLRGERGGRGESRTLLGRVTPCVGRDRELHLLTSTLHECISERVASAVLVTGAAGVGKSRLGHEFVRGIEARGEKVEVFVMRGDPLSAGSAFGMLAPGLRRRAGILEGEPIVIQRSKLETLVSRRLPPEKLTRITRFLGEMIGVPYDDEANPEVRAARDDAMLMGDQVRAAWEAWLAAVCEARPLVLVLEDLHYGDLPTVQAVAGALRTLRDAPLMVLALARPEVHERFPNLWVDRNVVEVRLSGLSRRASERLVREVLGEEPTGVEVARVIERADGNALYLEELIRALSEGKQDALPETVIGMVQARFDALDPEARRVLRAASVFGHVFWRGGAEALVGSNRGSVTVAEWVSELERHELVGRRDSAAFPGENDYAFRSGTMREAAYAMLTRADCVLGHRLAGKWLEGMGERDALVLAEHFERGQEPARALVWYHRAAEQALESNDFEAVIARAERGVHCGAEGETLGQLRQLQAEAHGWRGEFEKAARHARWATQHLLVGTVIWYRAMGELAFASAPLGQHDEVEQAASLLRAHPPASPSVAGAWAIAMCRTANQLALAGRHAAARGLIAEVDARTDLAPDDLIVAARVHQARGFTAFGSDKLDAALEGHRAAAACFEKAGARRHWLSSLTHLSFMYLEVGRYVEAEQLLRTTLAASERSGLTFAATMARIALGVALVRQARMNDPLADVREVTRTVMVEDRRLDGLSGGYLAEILALEGDLEGAEREASRAAAMLVPFPTLRARALGVLGDVLLARGQTARALEVSQEGMALLGGLGAILIGESLLRLANARALAESGDVAAARDAIRAARDCLLGRAARLTDPSAKQMLLAGVPENARTMALAAEWLGEPG
jgi:tetratricopeptide (TPR) repeat protein